jgi:hypothetical protein
MSIRCVCPNGHVLLVKDSLAGTAGLCPSCKGKVVVPKPHLPQKAPQMSEDAILDLLGKQSPSTRAATEESGVFLATSDSGIYGQSAKKPCNRCSREVSVGTHICPYCHTYIANINDF